jgi:glycerol-3-phosphate dehydrogenase
MTFSLSQNERIAHLHRMSKDGVDVLVIGGGITGGGVALEASARGYRVGLIDKSDFASGTSSKSTKLVHGGIRYLPQFDFALVHEALVERGRLVQNAPHLVKPLGFVLPYYAENKRPLGTPIVPPGGIGMSLLLRAGLLTYDVMSGSRTVGRHRQIGVSKTLELAPSLKTQGLKDGFIYFDGQTDDTRLTLTVLRTAAKRGAMLSNYAELLGFELRDKKIVAARVKDLIGGEEFKIYAKTIVNACGVFAAKIEAMAGDPGVVIEPAKGVHLTLPRDAIPMTDHAVVLPETPDGRLLFIVPWNTRVTLGTTDTKGGDVNAAVASNDDISYLIETANVYLRTKIDRSKIISSWAGFRPLIRPANGNSSTSKLSRTHVVLDGPGGMITITGGKLTTYRRMAQDALDHLEKREKKAVSHVTENLPLDGADALASIKSELKDASEKYDWDDDVVARLSQYGSEAKILLQSIAQEPSLSRIVAQELPYVMAEVVYACRYEMAMKLDDVLSRRLHLNFEDWSRGVDAAPAVANVMARELGWDASETQAQILRYAEKVEAERSAGQL